MLKRLQNSYLTIIWFAILGFGLGCAEALLVYLDRLMGLGGWYLYALNLGVIYALFFGLPFMLACLFCSKTGKWTLFGAYSAFLIVVLSARIYRIYWGNLVDEAMWSFALTALILITLVSVIGFPRRLRYLTVVPIYGFITVMAFIVVLQSPDPSYKITEPTNKPNIVWITADTLRSDHLTQYGHKYKVFEEFKKWSDDFVRFARSYSTSSWTAPSVASNLTALYPLQHGKSHGSIMNKDIVTLPQILNRAGYYTHAISNQPLVSPGWGFGKGFNRFYSTSTLFMETTLIDILNEFWLEEQMVQYISPLNVFYDRFHSTEQSPTGLWNTYQSSISEIPERSTFLYLYFFDPHSPYNPGSKWYPEKTKSVKRTRYFYQSEYAKPDGKPSDEVMTDVVRRYDGEINDVADKVDKILTDLKERGMYNDSLIIFTSDHGEKFYDHGEWLHGGKLYQEVTRVPLFVKFPDNKYAGKTSTVTVDGVDLFPTILDVMDVSVNMPYELSGESLLNDNGLKTKLPPPVMQLIGKGKSNYQVATVKNNKKYFFIHENDEVKQEAYEFTDPKQMFWEPVKNPSDTVFRELGDIVKSHQDFPYNPFSIGQSQREQLKALGYIE